MKRITVMALVAFVLKVHDLSGQQPVWLNHYGNGSPGNSPLHLVHDGAASLYGTGTLAEQPILINGQAYEPLGSRDVLLIKLDTAGQVQWVRTAGGSCPPQDLEYATGITCDPQLQHVIIYGQMNCAQTIFGTHAVNGSGGSNATDAFIAAYDSAGVCLWAKAVNGFDVNARKTLVDDNSAVFLFGHATTMGATFQGPPNLPVADGGFMAKYASDGSLLSADRLLTNGEIHDAVWYSPTEWILSGLGYTGATLNGPSIGINAPLGGGWLARCDTAGSLTWALPFNSSNTALLFRTQVMQSGDMISFGIFKDSLFVAGDTLTGPLSRFTPFLVRVAANGDLQWLRAIGSSEQAFLVDLELGPDDDVYAMGRFKSDAQLPGVLLEASSSWNSFIARFDPTNGHCEAAYHYGPCAFGSGSVVPTTHGLYVSGEFDSTMVIGTYALEASQYGAKDFLLMKFDSLSGFTGISAMPLQQGNLHIYANPNKGTCTIDLPTTLRLSDDLVLSIVDQTGQVVQRMPLRYTIVGVAIDIRAQATGIYHVELGDGAQRYTGTIVFE